MLLCLSLSWVWGLFFSLPSFSCTTQCLIKFFEDNFNEMFFSRTGARGEWITTLAQNFQTPHKFLWNDKWAFSCYVLMLLSKRRKMPQFYPFFIKKVFLLTWVCDKQMHSVGQANVIMLMIGLAFKVISKHIINHQITFIAIKPSIVLHLHWKRESKIFINILERKVLHLEMH